MESALAELRAAPPIQAGGLPAVFPWYKGKVEQPLDYVRERFWHGYPFDTLPRANQELHQWLEETANQWVHGTHHQVVAERWRQEQPLLGDLARTPFDTADQYWPKVHKGKATQGLEREAAAPAPGGRRLEEYDWLVGVTTDE